MENLEISGSETKRLHELASIYHDMAAKAKKLIAHIKDAESEVALLMENLEVVKREEEELYIQISNKNNVTKQVAIETVINTMLNER